MKGWRIVWIGFALVLGLVVAFDLLVTVVLRERFYRLYTQRLDAWVESNGPQDKIQSDVIPDCTKLIVSQAGPVQALLILFDRDDYDSGLTFAFRLR